MVKDKQKSLLQKKSSDMTNMLWCNQLKKMLPYYQ